MKYSKKRILTLLIISTFAIMFFGRQVLPENSIPGKLEAMNEYIRLGDNVKALTITDELISIYKADRTELSFEYRNMLLIKAQLKKKMGDSTDAESILVEVIVLCNASGDNGAIYDTAKRELEALVRK